MNEVEQLLERAEALAVERSDGHITLMRFTTCWKALLETPDLSRRGRDEVGQLKDHATIHEILARLEKPRENEIE